jgi:hypothetical protein
VIDDSGELMALRFCLCLFLAALLIGGLALHVNGDPAATAPATTQPAATFSADSSIRKWFVQLDDPDPKIRDSAKFELMGIAAADLPRLRQLVIDSQPVSPTQSAALRDIVLQSFLAGDPYTIKTDQGTAQTDASGATGPFFLGILWATVDLQDDARLGVSVDERLPGFPSYRFLRKGDMILGVYLDPDAPLSQLPNVETHNRTALIQTIFNAPAVQNVVLQVLRDGQTLKIPIKMAPRPMNADGNAVGSIRDFNNDRIHRAEAYWQQNFAPLLQAGTDRQIDASNLLQEP